MLRPRPDDAGGEAAGDDAGVTPAFDQDLDVEQMSAGAEEGGAAAASD